MTIIYFVRHAQPDHSCRDDRSRPLTAEGLADTRLVCEYFSDKKPDYIISSPYKRSYDTVKSTAEYHKMSIDTDIRLREREKGANGRNNLELFRKRWENLDYTDDGETIREVRRRNVEAVNELLAGHCGETIIVGTHGTALSALLSCYDSTAGFDYFMEIIDLMPCIVRAEFDGDKFVKRETVLSVHKDFR